MNIVDNIKFDGFDQIIFEGSGGILLDENYGFHPHTMWTTTTTENALKLWNEKATTLGVVRTYAIRHGNGPFVTEGKSILSSSERYNVTNDWQGSFRVGAFDLIATKYALEVNGGVDALVITHMDVIYPRLCDAYTNIASPFYDRVANKLLVQPKDGLKSQGRLTKALFNCKPHLVEFESNDWLVEELCNRLDLPLAITSSGAESNKKEVIGFPQHRGGKDL